LVRPAALNTNCAFVVLCEDWRRQKNPRGGNLIRELRLLADALENGRARVLAAVEAVWRCENVTPVCDAQARVIGNPDLAFRLERALKVAKWLFIGQDITDWDTSGRAMLTDAIRRALS